MAESPFEDAEEEADPNGYRELARTSFSYIAAGMLVLAAVATATIGGLVASGVAGEPLEQPDGFTFRTEADGGTPTLIVTHPAGVVPNAERVYVVDEADDRVAWTQLKVDGEDGVARVTGRDSDLACLEQGATYRIVFEGRTATDTVAAHEITQPIATADVGACESDG